MKWHAAGAAIAGTHLQFSEGNQQFWRYLRRSGQQKLRPPNHMAKPSRKEVLMKATLSIKRLFSSSFLVLVCGDRPEREAAPDCRRLNGSNVHLLAEARRRMSDTATNSPYPAKEPIRRSAPFVTKHAARQRFRPAHLYHFRSIRTSGVRLGGTPWLPTVLRQCGHEWRENG